MSASWKTFALGGSFSLAAMIAGGGDVNGDGIGGGTDDAVIYLRTDRNTGNQYIGQSSSYSRYTRRQYEHGYNNPAADYEFEVLGRAKPGTDLDVLEEDYIRLYGGPGVLENKRHQMNDWRYTQAGGTVPLP